MIRIVLVLFLYTGVGMIYGQSYSLSILPADENSSKQLSRLNYNTKPNGIIEAKQELQQVLLYFYERGYLTASIDSIDEDSSSMQAWLYAGEVYQLSQIRQGNANAVFLGQSGFKERQYRDRPFNHDEIRELSENILGYCENNGYPFATVKLDSVEIKSNRDISASLRLELNQKVSIDTIIIKGNSKLNRKFIRNYFNIKKGDLYDESKVQRIEGKLRDLPFVNIIRPYEIVFTDDKASLVLYIDKKKASQFDGILGIAPNDQTTGKLLLTGDVKLKLMSAFNRGELIDFNWRKLEAQSQDLKFHFNFPFLFASPFGIDYKLHLFKKDTSYLTFSNNIGIQVLFRGYNHVKAFYENQTSNLLSTYGLEFATVLPQYADVNTSLYGLGFDYRRLDYFFNPRKGFLIELSSGIGSKKIKKNANINQALYDSIPLSSTLYRLELDAGWFIPLLRNSTILIGNKSGFLENKNLFENELFRIGGLKTLRGFDEESLTASIFTVFTLEYRFIFDDNSFFQVFLDAAWYERNSTSYYLKDTPYGFGIGVNFETKAGIFALSYAMGKSESQELQFKSAKIHFGLTAKF